MISAALAVLESEEQRNELSEIYENNISNFYNIAFQQLHNKHDAEDAIQDAFLAIANNTSIFFGIPNENKMCIRDRGSAERHYSFCHHKGYSG